MNKEAAEFEMGLRRLAIACTNDPLLFVRSVSAGDMVSWQTMKARTCGSRRFFVTSATG